MNAIETTTISRGFAWNRQSGCACHLPQSEQINGQVDQKHNAIKVGGARTEKQENSSNGRILQRRSGPLTLRFLSAFCVFFAFAQMWETKWTPFHFSSASLLICAAQKSWNNIHLTAATAGTHLALYLLCVILLQGIFCQPSGEMCLVYHCSATPLKAFHVTPLSRNHLNTIDDKEGFDQLFELLSQSGLNAAPVVNTFQCQTWQNTSWDFFQGRKHIFREPTVPAFLRKWKWCFKFWRARQKTRFETFIFHQASPPIYCFIECLAILRICHQTHQDILSNLMTTAAVVAIVLREEWSSLQFASASSYFEAEATSILHPHRNYYSRAAGNFLWELWANRM